MRKLFLVNLFVGACLLFNLPAYAKAHQTILIVGDSLSAAYGFDSQKSWVSLLQEKLHTTHYAYKVINLSISGSTTSNGLSVLPEALKTHTPEITIIALGGNDGLRGINLTVIKHNLQEMISLAKKQSKVLLLGVRLPPNYGIIYTQQFQAIFPELAKRNKISLVPLILKGIDDQPNFMQEDGIHPTASAQSMILNNLWPALKNLL